MKGYQNIAKSLLEKGLRELPGEEKPEEIILLEWWLSFDSSF